MKKRRVEENEYALTREEALMLMEVCCMCINNDIHVFGDNTEYFDRIKEISRYFYNEIKRNVDDVPVKYLYTEVLASIKFPKEIEEWERRELEKRIRRRNNGKRK